VDASWQAAGCNTNLGIVLLCAPLLAAAERVGMNAGVAPLRQAVAQVLDGLTVADAAAAFRAIARANPGGLGRADAQDVHAAPTVTLRQAMALAADRDSLARQYRDGFADLFEHALPAFEAARAGGHAATTAAGVHRVFLVFLAGWPDSHIVRKHGEALAHSVMAAAQPWARRAAALEAVGQDPQWADWDDRLKQQALNPGSSADLTVATLLLAALLGQPLAEGG
jgi:triphosphoribosyl-dephospho-CoA synthase